MRQLYDQDNYIIFEVPYKPLQQRLHIKRPRIPWYQRQKPPHMSLEPHQIRHLGPIERRPDKCPRVLPILPILSKDASTEKRRPDIAPYRPHAKIRELRRAYRADVLRLRGVNLRGAERFPGECGAVY